MSQGDIKMSQPYPSIALPVMHLQSHKPYRPILMKNSNVSSWINQPIIANHAHEKHSRHQFTVTPTDQFLKTFPFPNTPCPICYLPNPPCPCIYLSNYPLVSTCINGFLFAPRWVGDTTNLGLLYYLQCYATRNVMYNVQNRQQNTSGRTIWCK